MTEDGIDDNMQEPLIEEVPDETEPMEDNFTAGSYPWNILMFPRGNREGTNAAMSLYLNAADADTAPLGWMRRASFKLTVVNHLSPEQSFTKRKQADHNFSAGGVDWGFTSFMNLRDLLDPKKGYLVDDTLTVSMDKTDNLHYDSKKETGFVGLKNQGATCYMNSLLQFLYNINYFRQAVYHMPTAEEDIAKSIPLALQSLFYKLQFGESSVSTKDLTKSFGWDSYDAFMQHDVQELNRVLQEKLEDKMKGTKVEGTIGQLFEGHMHMFIECINVDYKSTRQESFMDLQLDVKGCKHIYDSFDKYCEVEVMDGQNQYKTDDHGLQDARKGVLFDDFPPVLQLQLKRFEYDFRRDIMVKINDRYEFPDELDLDYEHGKYLSENADRSVRNLYRLHSVLVHSGGVHGGHYYAFIRPDGKHWFKFDDEKVSVEDAKKALNEQYGGEDENPPPGTGFNTFKFTKYSNAYMLVYVRTSHWDKIMCEVGKSDIQDHVRMRLEAEKEEKEARRREKQEAHLYTVFRIVTDADIRDQIGHNRWFDLADQEKVKTFRVKKQMLFGEFRELVAEELGVPLEQQRFWTFAKRQNSTLRPARALQPSEDEARVTDLKDSPVNNRLQQPQTIALFLETAIGPAKELPPINKNMILLFLKLYKPKTQTLRYVGRIFVLKTQRFADLYPLLLKRAELPEDTKLAIYEEIKFDPTVMVELQNPNHSLANAQLEDGDILCLQEQPREDDMEELPYPTVKDYLVWVRNRMTVTFRRLDQPKEAGVVLELSRDLDYDGVAAALTEALRKAEQAEAAGLTDPALLRFTAQQPFVNAPKPQPVKWHGFDTLASIMVHYSTVLDTVFYEILDIPLREFEQLKTLKVQYHGERTEPVSQHDVRVPKDDTVGDVLEALRKQLPEDKRPAALRLLEVFYSKIYKVFAPDEKIDSIDDRYWQVRAEPIPEEEMEPPQSTRRIHAYHVNPDATNNVNFGHPFILQIGEEETLADIKPRIQAKLGVPEEDFVKWRFAFMVNLRQPEYLEDEDVVALRFARQSATHGVSTETSYLGLEHADTGPKRPHPNSNRFSQYERPVKIYN
ncbi:cysteine proteinase [Coccomyxa subellipsoidea C-169]|uniref:ubiquitinyl hydrolase 1 n=1 Tax=Coccomyxa subellipsoidea (strain C-169) TaxID=574566 RepID=I0Z7N3_COCSC|nr:cysteine proteinase [Coccomyxa subellipsoidea C-169]EIE26652.1 cysteine proteinase [Coccomyxa subellipsoidea C-169]|eukprot:XP_005651196.1 cysteine proteinase [Coccomyxa subellipsoidea C-169]